VRSSSNVGSAAGSGSTGGQQSQLFATPGRGIVEPDLWGKVRNTVHASQYQAQLTAADLENERLTEQASLAEYFFEIRGQDALQQILNDTVELTKKRSKLCGLPMTPALATKSPLSKRKTTYENAQSAANQYRNRAGRI